MCQTLIVEDNLMFREVLKRTLFTWFPAMGIDEASNSHEALQKIAHNFPDIIFMDIKLSGGNGLELTKTIKESFDSHAIIIILTSCDLPEYREAACRNGANYFFSKQTTSSDEIVLLIKSILLDAQVAQETVES